MNELAYNNFMYRFHRNVQANGSFVDIIINIIRGLCCDQPPLLIPLIELKNKQKSFDCTHDQMSVELSNFGRLCNI